MKTLQIRPLVLAGLLATAMPAAAATFSWFDDASPAGALAVNPWAERYAAFSLDLYRTPENASEIADDAAAADSDTLRMYGGIAHDNRFEPVTPFLFETRDEPLASSRLKTLGVAWRHRLDSASHFTFAADRRHGTPPLFGGPDTADTRATVSLTNAWRGDYQPRLTGSVFVGGETPTTETYRSLGRRYYGLAVGGELTLFRAHTPYVSFQAQRGLTGNDDSLLSGGLDDDRSQLAAGWKWQAKPYLSLQAEASYGYSGNRLRWQNPERSRLFFGTRFDFK